MKAPSINLVEWKLPLGFGTAIDNNQNIKISIGSCYLAINNRFYHSYLGTGAPGK